MIKCALCGFEFDENSAKKSCERCILKNNCSLLRCPNCGYEIPDEPQWIKKIKKILGVTNDKIK